MSCLPLTFPTTTNEDMRSSEARFGCDILSLDAPLPAIPIDEACLTGSKYQLWEHCLSPLLLQLQSPSTSDTPT